MWPLAKAVLLIARYFRRIAISLETLTNLYKMDLEARNIYTYPIDPNRIPTPDEMTEIQYSTDINTRDSEDY